jgi:ubiquinone/menaquinone biosynthesis C-methylase UbiE
MKAECGGNRDVPYILVHSDREIRRLNHQAGIVNPITKRILLAAGIGPGMRVLDVGCGAGDVTFLISEIVGREGQVVGIDRADAALAAAQARATNHPLQNVSFQQGEPASLSFEKPFDAAAGRYVLMFQADPPALLRAVARHVRPGGVVAFHEPDWDGCRSRPTAQTYERCCRWIVETFKRSGIETNMGVKLYEAFRSAGMAAPSMSLEAVIGGTQGGNGWVHQMAELVVTMLPEIVAKGVATVEEVEIDTLEERMLREINSGSVIVGRSETGAWSFA